MADRSTLDQETTTEPAGRPHEAIAVADAGTVAADDSSLVARADKPHVAASEGEPSRARGRTPTQILWMKLRSNRAAMFGLYLLIVLYAGAIFAGFFAPYQYDDAVHEQPFH